MSTPVSLIPVAIDYTSRDYYSLREALIARIQARVNTNAETRWTASDPADFGVALVEAFAYMGDLISYYIDRVANESFIESATQRETLLSIAQTYGYEPAGYRQAYVNLLFVNASLNDVLIPQGTVVSGEVTIEDTVQTVYFTTNADVFVAAESNGNVSASEGRSIQRIAGDVNSFGELVGQSTQTPQMTFKLSKTGVIENTIKVYVEDGVTYSKWEKVQHILDYGPTDLVYTATVDQFDNVYIKFGDGVSGAIPTLNLNIRVDYTVGIGTIGNVPNNSLTTIEYVPGLSESQTIALQSSLTVNNQESATGGANPESDAQIRFAAPLALKSSNRAVTLADYENLAITVTGVGKANAIADIWTSITLYIAPSRNEGDSDPSPGLDDLGATTEEYASIKEEVESFLEDKKLIGTSVTVQPPVYTDIVVQIQYVREPQYTSAEVESALKLLLLNKFGYTRMPFEDTLYPQDFEFEAQQSVGIKTAKVLALYRVGGVVEPSTLVGDPDEIFRLSDSNITFVEA